MAIGIKLIEKILLEKGFVLYSDTMKKRGFYAIEIDQ